MIPFIYFSVLQFKIDVCPLLLLGLTEQSSLQTVCSFLVSYCVPFDIVTLAVGVAQLQPG